MNPQEIKDLKAKHGEDLHLVTISLGEKKHEFVLKKPSRNVIEAITSATGISQQNEILLTNCVVFGDTNIIQDGDVYLSLLEEIGKIQGKATSEVKKL